MNKPDTVVKVFRAEAPEMCFSLCSKKDRGIFMEMLAEQPHKTESFDRYLRAYNDATTWLAETLDGSMRTPFEYSYNGHDLIAEDGSNVGTIFRDAIKDAERLAQERPELGFESRRRWLELQEYGAMLDMANGEAPNTMIVISDFPPELMDAREDVGGYNVTRQQTMLRVLTWHDGKLVMYSQSLDGSNRQALESIYANFGVTPEPGELLGQRVQVDVPTEDQKYLVDRLTGIYDRSLTEQYGGEFYAGRREGKHDTYRFVLSQRELIDRFVHSELYGDASPNDRYNIAALMSKRFDKFKNSTISVREYEIVLGNMPQQNLEWQLRLAGNEARAAGQVFSGCGASNSGRLAEDQLTSAGYGNKSQEDGDCEFVSKECPLCRKKNVKTIVRKISSDKKRISGACGCSKYVKA